jgi:O-antigen chain-terminating methyltransferase
MSADELDRLDRERREADARYNAALTALDRAIVSMDGREPSGGDIARVGTALLQFLQQITAFVETKDRQLAAEANARGDRLTRALEPIDELRTQLTVLRRAVESHVSSLTSQVTSNQPSAPSAQLPAPSPQPPAPGSEPPAFPDDFKYVGFEDEFRGADAVIEERLREYIPLVAGCSDVLDIGCGRGELLAALKAAGVPARGIDANEAMVAAARDRGLDAARADALTYVAALAGASLGGIVSTQVVEHLEPAYLVRLLDAAARALRPGAPIVLETINPACWLAFFSSYIRDLTHVRPVHPETLQYLLRASGFERVTIRYSAPVPEHMKMKTIDLPAGAIGASDPVSAALAHVAQTMNANAAILNNLMFTHLDYAAVGYRM